MAQLHDNQQSWVSEGVGRGVLQPLDFEILHFPIKFSAKKGNFLSFVWVN